ncbi:hypothetical protein A2Z33_04470 [Candidatus Gottesmanbacteria bacterium RBG_16_52_11]|uniref:Uncharacterized protein n=1 Tax=Candidatus Gottesmanbacteria bacterium RBG_16_52_11 TaxID=1798374 RepID=A0A1F5YWP6_9BACT|nr:MAG: hypothetical protein A2Z33_04470 [Candidatus Gottesmanbacteria bacterium RBG_16_52_11]
MALQLEKSNLIHGFEPDDNSLVISVSHPVHDREDQLTGIYLETREDLPGHLAVTFTRTDPRSSKLLSPVETIQLEITCTDPEKDLPVVRQLLMGAGRVFGVSDVIPTHLVVWSLEDTLAEGNTDDLSQLFALFKEQLRSKFREIVWHHLNLETLDFSDLAEPAPGDQVQV